MLIILVHIDWDRLKEKGLLRIIFYTAALIIALAGLFVLISLITLVLLERFDDRYRESHPEEFGQIFHFENDAT
ncbi:hypothetical protein V1502_09570 [Bacillus sp. SCS-153A]|uniref:hypothetical protein n=1 Tax=Rossellomorea sedimentorum TaxID=3115294 RepID=UPI003905DCDB